MRAGGVALFEAALEQDETGLEIVLVRREFEGGVEAHLAVGEVDAAVGAPLVEQLPENPARDALHEIVAVDERARVVQVVPHLGARPRRARSAHGLSRTGARVVGRRARETRGPARDPRLIGNG
jgi:hypothetical protein